MAYITKYKVSQGGKVMEKNMKANEYIITSERRRSDEIQNEFYSYNIYDVGDVIILDGIRWYIEEVIEIGS